MLYAILIYGSEAEVSALSKEEDDALIAQHLVVQQKLSAERKLGPVVRLVGTRQASTIRKGAENFVVDGPFAETKEQLLGFYVVDCATQQEAEDAARLVGTACTSRMLEVRPISWFQPGDVA